MRQPPRLSVRMVFRRCLAALARVTLLTFSCSILTPAQAPSDPSRQATQNPADKSAHVPAKSPEAAPAPPATAEVVTRDSATAFKVRVNLVLLRVVVRDQNGKVVDNLKREDFQLFDNRKPQTISTFSLETPASHTVPVVTVSDHPDEGADTNPAVARGLPQRFVSLLFDDLHLAMQDAVFVRVAAGKVFDSMAPSDRVGIFTTSGQFSQEFTGDHELLRKSLNQIIARPLADSNSHDCPDISYYQADLIVNKNDQQSLSVATEDTVQCAFNGDETQASAARSMASAAANRALNAGDTSSDYTYRHMEDALRRF